eukprot:SAG22_NODE_334_length_12094_cov_9.446019_1_plen_116_part_00
MEPTPTPPPPDAAAAAEGEQPAQPDPAAAAQPPPDPPAAAALDPPARQHHIVDNAARSATNPNRHRLTLLPDGSVSQRQCLGLLHAEPGPFTGRAWAFYRQSLGLLQADGSVSKP